MMKVPYVIRSRLVVPVSKRKRPGKLKSIGNHVVKQIEAVLSWLQSFKLLMVFIQMLQNICIYVLSAGPVPEHVSFIMDGNRTYAKKSGLAVKKGHEVGGITLLSVCYACKKIGISCVSAYAFSIENFNRSPEEVDILLTMFANKLDEFASRAIDFRDPLYGSRLRVIGDHSLVSEEMRSRIKNVERITESGNDFTLYICFPYTSRNDIFHSIYYLVEKCQADKFNSRDITVSVLTRSMYLDEFSNKCDLLIRTSGHMRFSDYMLWQVHENSDVRFTSTLWPEFNFIKLYFMLLKWSFFATIQRYTESEVSLKDRLLVRLSCKVKKTTKRSISILESLPQPPIAMSITGETD